MSKHKKNDTSWMFEGVTREHERWVVQVEQLKTISVKLEEGQACRPYVVVVVDAFTKRFLGSMCVRDNDGYLFANVVLLLSKDLGIEPSEVIQPATVDATGTIHLPVWR